MGTKVKELQSNPLRAQPAPKQRPGRIRHDALWAQAMAAWRPGLRVWVETQD